MELVIDGEQDGLFGFDPAVIWWCINYLHEDIIL